MGVYADNVVNLYFKGYEDTIKMNLQEVKMKECFSDVTIACEDKEIKVHRIIISLASPILKTILKQNLNQNSFVYFTATKYSDLENVIKYIYLGEVNIEEKELDSFLNLIKDLEIDFTKETNDSFKYNIKSYGKNDFINKCLPNLEQCLQLDNKLYELSKEEQVFPVSYLAEGENIIDNKEPLKAIEPFQNTKEEKYEIMSNDFINKCLPNKELYLHLDNKVYELSKEEQIFPISYLAEGENKVDNKEFLKEIEPFQNTEEEKNELMSNDYFNKCLPNLEQYLHLDNKVYELSKEEQVFPVSYLAEDENKVDNKEILKEIEPFQKIEEEKNEVMSTSCDKVTSRNTKMKLGKHKCILCGYESKGKVLLNKHIRENHKEKEDNVCYLCSNSFKTTEGVKKHIMGVHLKQKKISCDLCNYFSRDNFDMKKHLKGFHSQKFNCDSCPKWFTNEQLYKSHKNKHGKNNKLCPCDICNKQFPSNSKLNRHKREHLRTHKITCEICTKSFRDSCDLKRHFKTHLPKLNKPKDLKALVCDMCDYTCIENSALQKHKQDNHIGEIFHCDNCNKEFKNRESLKSHLKLHDPINWSQCDMCEKKFSSYARLNRHRKSHFGGGNIQCETCAKTFRDMYDYKRHIVKHEKLRCETCVKTFTDLSVYNKHLIKHQKIKEQHQAKLLAANSSSEQTPLKNG